MTKDRCRELSTLFFEMKQIIRNKLPKNEAADPNAWLRCETIRFVQTHGDPSMRDIAQYLRITAPSATSLIANLERLGHVRRAKKKEDKRIVRIQVTPKGTAALKTYDRRTAKTLQVVFDVLPDKELSELRRILRELKRLHS